MYAHLFLFENLQQNHWLVIERGVQLLELQGVSKKWGAFELKDITFSLPKGYIMGLIGPNGSGKSTLIRSILGLYRVSAGTILFDGKTMGEEEEQIRQRLGIVLDENLYSKNCNSLQNGEIYGRLFSSYDPELFRSYLDRFGVDPKRKLKHLSKGNVIRFQLAFALSHGADLFIFDEPEAGLDADFRKELMDLMLELIEDGTRSVLMSTHITEDLDRVADYITYLKNGRVIYTGTKESLSERFVMVKAEDYKIRLLPREAVLYAEQDHYSSRALVVNSHQYPLDESYTVERPSIAEIMYCIEKGGVSYVEHYF